MRIERASASVGCSVGRCLAVAVLLAAGSSVAGPAAAQAGERTEGETVDLVFDREVFHYPAFERRNPFRPLTGDDAAGPRFENLVLFGILQSEDPGGSVALFGVSRGGTQVAGQTYRLREGNRIGNSRILEIRTRQVVMEVEEFGLVETRTLQLERALPQPRPGSNDAGSEAAPGASPPDEAEPDTLEIGFDRSRSELDFIHDGRTGNGGWS